MSYKRIFSKVAHRGASYRALENTKSAFTAAIADGCDSIELDVRCTADGHPVVLHDHTLMRSAARAHRISKVNSQDLAAIRLYNGETLPFLQDILDHYLPQVELILDLKEDRIESVRACAQMVHKHALGAKVVMSSFYPRVIKSLRSEFPSLRTAYIWGKDTFAIHPLFYFQPLRGYSTCGALYFHPQVEYLSRSLMQKCRRHNIPVLPWVPLSSTQEMPHKREQLWRILYQWGCIGLCTNDVRSLARWMKGYTRQHSIQHKVSKE